jgi:hypothetical protein
MIGSTIKETSVKILLKISLLSGLESLEKHEGLLEQKDGADRK